SPEVRRKLRQRARYEVANNSYAKGIVLTLANDCIGTGPRLQLLSDDDQLNSQMEAAFAQWSKAVNLAEKLRSMRMAKATDGETFAVLGINPQLDSPVQIDVQLVEADRVTETPDLHTHASIDGIVMDAWGNPQAYTILKRHPGDMGSASWMNDHDVVDAESV